MSFNMHKVQVWVGEVPDRPAPLPRSWSCSLRPGPTWRSYSRDRSLTIRRSSLIFLAPITGPEQIEAAQSVGLTPARDITMLCVEGDNRRGIGFQLMSHLAVAGINLRGISISAVGQRFAAYLAFDNPHSATLATQTLATLVS